MDSKELPSDISIDIELKSKLWARSDISRVQTEVMSGTGPE
jgi:hypothetical protein